MYKRNNIGFSVSLLLGRVGVGLFVVCFASCKTSSQAPLDDAYYWPDKNAQSVHSTPNTPSMEIISQQDTTITVHIKR